MTLHQQLTDYLTRTQGAMVVVEDLARIPGGASRETYRYDVIVDGARKGFILRRDPVGSLIDTDRRIEFAAIRSFAGKGVAAPEAIVLETDVTELERPFFIMARIDGGLTGSPFQADPYGEHARVLGQQFFNLLGWIAAEPIEGMALLAVTDPPAPNDCWREQLDYWAGVIDSDEDHPQPIVRAAIRRLRGTPPPPPARIAVVHGDFRTGNFLHDGAGRIIAVLDWEMAHLGDPLEDLAWALDPLWTVPGDKRISGMVEMDEALKIWGSSSGLQIDPVAFAWWRLFASVKAQAIWISAAKAWKTGGMAEPVLAFSGWYTARRQDEILARWMLEAAPK